MRWDWQHILTLNPLVNVNEKLWKRSTMLLMAKSTISTGPFSSLQSVCMFTLPGIALSYTWNIPTYGMKYGIYLDDNPIWWVVWNMFYFPFHTC